MMLVRNIVCLAIANYLMTSYWLMKSEPHVYSWENLVDDGSTHWDGVRITKLGI